MKKIYWITPIIFTTIILFLATDCKKDEPAKIPLLSTSSITEITTTTAACGGDITSDGGTTITSRGVCWRAVVANPTIADSKTVDGTGTGQFVSSINGLNSGVTYHVKAYATNSVGTAFGDDITFTTASSGTISDVDGNIYNTVIIGTQIWMKENLKTINYNDGTSIPLVTVNAVWTELNTPGYCWYNNDSATYNSIYGALYNWFAVDAASNGGKNVCPANWHIPTYTEWKTLTTHLGGLSVAGGKLKETGTTHWLSPNTGATNESGFTALPGGFRYRDGKYDAVGYWGQWWSSTEEPTGIVWFSNVYYADARASRNGANKRDGLSVRCLKDN